MKRILSIVAGAMVCIFVFAGCGSQTPQAVQSFEQDLTGTVILEDVTLTINETGSQSQILPPNPYGYYNYYQEYEGYQYYVASVTVQNNGETAFNPNTCKVTADMPDQSTAEGKLVLLNAIDSDFKETLDSGRECNGYLFILAKQEQGTPQAINVYYNHGFASIENVQQYDMKAILRVLA